MIVVARYLFNCLKQGKKQDLFVAMTKVLVCDVAAYH